MAEVKKRTLRAKLQTNLALPESLELETWRANATDIQIGIFDADGVAAITNVQSVNCKVQPSQLNDSTVMDSTVAAASMNADLLASEWSDGTGQHATFSFTNSQTNLDITLCSKDFWIVFTAILTDGSEVTLAAGTLTIHEDNNAAGDDPDENPGTAITLEQGDARYLQPDDIAPDLTMQESAGIIPFRLPANVSPYTDADADAVIAATSTTDERATAHYQRICQTFKGLGIWNDLENAYLLGSEWQSSSTTLQSITGGNTAVGTGTQSAYSTAFDGTSNKYLFSNINAGTAVTAKTFIAIYKHDGVSAPAALISNYQGGSTKAMSMTCGGSPTGTTGPTLIDDAFGYASNDGTSTGDTDLQQNEGNDYAKWSTAILSQNDGNLTLYCNRRNANRGARSTQWINNSNLCIGANPNNSYFFEGDIVFAAVFDGGVTDYQAFALRLAMESILSDVVDFPSGIVFDGNSLTASASGGGTRWTNQLMAMAGWSGYARNETNIAKDGAKQTQEVEQEYFTQARQWIGLAGQDNLYFLWSGINDITAGVATQDIIDSLKRHSQRAKAEGFRLVLLTLTPVASDGDGTAYTYSTAQQASLAAVNVWIKSEGAIIADQVVDLDEIGIANPLFLDPTDDTYYTTGDGLHHNDAGRALIAAKINSDVAYPTL